MAKKKERKDFQKVKLKVGRKLKKENETNTDFKVKRIVLKEASRNDAIKAIVSSNAPSSNQLKLVYLKKLSEGHLTANPNEITGEVINALSKYLLDSDYRVRNEAIKCLKQCLLSFEHRQQSFAPFIDIMLNYVQCGLTHIDDSICVDSRKLFNFIVEKADKTMHNQLMATTITRLNCSSPETSDYEMFVNVVNSVYTHCDEQTFKPIEIKWSSENCYCDINSKLIKEPNYNLNLSFQEVVSTDIKSSFTSFLINLVEKDIKFLVNRRNWSFSEEEAKKSIAVLEIYKKMKMFKRKEDSKLEQVPEISIVLNQKQKRKQETAINNLKQKLQQLISLLL